MERMGLVSWMTQELERLISQDRLPPGGRLPSENMLARRYGVSRTTVREALVRLEARGLVVRHPGRQSRALVLDKVVTLETLGVTLHRLGQQHLETRQWLEGYLVLKRKAAVEVLAACCEHASAAEVDRLLDVCFALRDGARWEQSHQWVQREFELLRLAAQVSRLPGQVLLIQSLERSFWTMADKVLPLLDGAATREWAVCVFGALVDREAGVVRGQLQALLQAADARLLERLAPASGEADTPEDSPYAAEPLPTDEPAPAEGELPGASAAELYDCMTASSRPPPAEAAPPEVASTDSDPPPACTALTGSGRPEASSEEPLAAEKSELRSSEERLPGANAPDLYDCMTGSCLLPPAGAPSPEAGPPGDCPPWAGAALAADQSQGRAAAPEPGMPSPAAAR